MALCICGSIVDTGSFAVHVAGTQSKDATQSWTSRDEAGEANAVESEAPADHLPATASNDRASESSVQSLPKVPFSTVSVVALVLSVAIILRLPLDYFASRKSEKDAFLLVKDNMKLIDSALAPAYHLEKALSSNDLWCMVDEYGTRVLEANKVVAERMHRSELPLGSVPLNALVYLVKDYLRSRDQLSLKVRTDIGGFFGLQTTSGRVQGIEGAVTYHLAVVKTLAPMHFHRPLRSEELNSLVQELLPVVNEVRYPTQDDLSQLHIKIGAVVRRFVATVLQQKHQEVTLEVEPVDTWDIYDSELALQEFLDDFQQTRGDLLVKPLPEKLFRSLVWEFYINVNAQALYEKERGNDICHYPGDERYVAFKVIERNLVEHDMVQFKPATPVDFYPTHDTHKNRGTIHVGGNIAVGHTPEP